LNAGKEAEAMCSIHTAPHLATYRIRVRGNLAKLSGRFDGFEIEDQASGEALLTGTIVDRDALRRVLCKIRDLGMSVQYLQVAEMRLPLKGRVRR
jgi:hypothetical protein